MVRVRVGILTLVTLLRHRRDIVTDRCPHRIWELRKRRRPPRMGEWYIESIGSSDADGTFDVA